MSEKWDKRFLDLAFYISQWSKDPSTKVGAIITKKRIIISTGYNGFAIGVNDNPCNYNNRSFKYKTIIHAEENALLSTRQDLNGCSIYVCPVPPCASCASKIIPAGIIKVVSYKPPNDFLERWEEDMKITVKLFNDTGIEFILY